MNTYRHGGRDLVAHQPAGVPGGGRNGSPGWLACSQRPHSRAERTRPPRARRRRDDHSPAYGARIAIPRRLRPPECVANSDRPVSRSARASVCRQWSSSRGTSPIQAAKSRPDPKNLRIRNGRRDRGCPDNTHPADGLQRWLASFEQAQICWNKHPLRRGSPIWFTGEVLNENDY